MSARLRLLCSAALLLAAPLAGRAQTPATAPAAAPSVGPPVQRIASASAVSTEPLGAVMGVRELPDGRILVNDGLRRRLLLMDSTLKTVAVVLDSASGVANTYGSNPGALLPFRGDSTLFVDAASFAMLVLDPAGKVVRVRSVWRVQDLAYFGTPMGMNAGYPGVDARGRMVYRVPAQPAPPRVRPPAGVPYFPPQPDSAFVVAVDLETRRADTVGVVRVPGMEMTARRRPDGSYAFNRPTHPFPVVDEWAVLPDGVIAFVRGRDYRVDYLGPDGKLTSSPRLPFPWQRLTDEDKERLVDSVRVAEERFARRMWATSMVMWVNQNQKSYPPGFTLPEGFTLPPGLPRDALLPPGATFPANYLYACAPGQQPSAGMGGGGPQVNVSSRVMVGAPGGAVSADGPPPAIAAAIDAGAAAAAVARAGAPGTPGSAGASAAPGAAAPGAGASPGAATRAAPAAACSPSLPTMNTGRNPPTMNDVSVVRASELPDYRPAIAQGAVRADLDGNLWIRTLAPPTPGGPVFDVVSREGVLTTRLQLLPGYTIAGFGRGKVVYLTSRDMTGIKLARVRLK